LAKSFDIALHQFLTAEGSEADTPDNRGRLAARLVVLATYGEQSEQRLAAEAVLYLRAFAAAMRIASDKPRSGTAASTQRIAVGPDVVIAMSQALKSCIEELPESGVSSTARQVLHEAILEAAGQGQRDADTLKHYALEMLRTRA
jgi:hypothetical protein